MSEDGHSDEAEIWARYLKAGLSKQLLDFSALYRLSHIISKNPDLNELHSSLISEFFNTVLFPQESEIEAIFGLMVAGTIIANLRSWTKGDNDADFLSRLLKFSVPKFELNINKGWSAWVDALTWTLQEWKQNYAIVYSLSSAVKKLLSGKEHQNLKDVHFTALIDLDAVDALMRRTPSEYVTLNLLRVWEHSLCPSNDQGKDVSPYVLLPSCNGEGWDDLVSLTNKYVKSVLAATPEAVLFRTVQDKFSILILNFVKMHSAAFVESSVGACVRALASLVQGRNLKEFLQSSNFRGAVDELVTYLKYTLENMHEFSPLLAKFICVLCDAIREAKGTNEYWQELSGLLVLRVLAPAISNPLVYGIVDFCGPAAMNVLKETTKLLHHIWLGKPVELGDLSDVPWVNGMIPQWQGQLQTALASMMAARKAEPKPFILPKALVIFDLMELTKAFAASGMQLSRFPESPSITKLKGGPKASLKPPLPSKKRDTSPEEIEEKIATDDQEISLFGQGKGDKTWITNDTGQEVTAIISKPKRTPHFIPTSPRTVELLEDSTPSVAALPPVFGGLAEPQVSVKKQLVPIADEEMETVRSDHDGALNPQVSVAWANSRGMQTTSCTLKQKAMQTEVAETCAKAVQALEYACLSESTQTDPESERFKLKARLRDEVYVKDREVETEFSWEQIAADKLHAEKELVQLKQYQNNEEQRTQTLNAYWGNQFQDLKRENTDLKDQIRALKEEIQRLQVPVYEEDTINQRASYLDLRETLKEQHFVTDERILQQIDPRTYIPGDFSHYKKSSMSFNFRSMSPVKNHRYESMSFRTEK